MNSAYHPHLLLKKYCIIKNKTLAKILIAQSDPVNVRAKNAKTNRNKLLWAGTVFYILVFVLAVFSISMRLIPDIPVERFTYGSMTLVLTGGTLNAKLPTLLAYILLFSETAFSLINTSKYAVEKTTAKRLVQILYYVFTALCLLSALGGLWMVLDTILCLL